MIAATASHIHHGVRTFVGSRRFVLVPARSTVAGTDAASMSYSSAIVLRLPPMKRM